MVKAANETCFEFVYGDAHGVTYLRDLRYCCAGIDADAHSNVEQFIHEWHGSDKSTGVVIELPTSLRVCERIKSASDQHFASWRRVNYPGQHSGAACTSSCWCRRSLCVSSLVFALALQRSGTGPRRRLCTASSATDSTTRASKNSCSCSSRARTRTRRQHSYISHSTKITPVTRHWNALLRLAHRWSPWTGSSVYLMRL